MRVRLAGLGEGGYAPRVSIHAPVRGATGKGFSVKQGGASFNPRTREGRRPALGLVEDLGVLFVPGKVFGAGDEDGEAGGPRGEVGEEGVHLLRLLVLEVTPAEAPLVLGEDLLDGDAGYSALRSRASWRSSRPLMNRR